MLLVEKVWPCLRSCMQSRLLCQVNGANALAKALQGQGLACLFIACSIFSDVLVARAGSKSCTIKRLNLSNNAIGFQGAAYIAEALANAETLEELNLSGASPCCHSLGSFRDGAVFQLTLHFRRKCLRKCRCARKYSVLVVSPATDRLLLSIGNLKKLQQRKTETTEKGFLVFSFLRGHSVTVSLSG